jgi:class 3 adenylate cyclase
VRSSLKILRNLTLRSKIMLMLLPASLLSMALAAFIGYVTARDALTTQVTAQLTAVRSSKKTQIEAYFRNLRDTFGVFAEDVAVVSAAQGFTDGFNQLGRQKLAPERTKALESFYRELFTPELNKAPGFENMSAESLIPRTDRGAEAQALFMVENPNKAGERVKLSDHPVSNPYTLAHYTYHPWLSDLAKRLKLYDLFIVSEDGNVVYSAAKEPDFATNLNDGPYSTTVLGRLFRQVVGEHRRGYVKLSDFEFYAASGGAPAQFIATPIYANFKLVGVLIGQVSIDEISRTLNGERSWQADGLGTTGFAYVTGPSMLLRNDHRTFVERRDEFLADAKTHGYRDTEVDAMARQGTTVLRYKMNTEGVRQALQGAGGVVNTDNVLGRKSMQAFAPLSIPDLTWILNVEMEHAEIFAPLERLKWIMMVVACVLTLLSSLFAMLMAAQFVKPIRALVDGIDAVKAGRTDIQVIKRSDDEIGQLADNFNTMTLAIKDRDGIIAGKNKAYASLLTRLFPGVVADRMRAGEEQIIDTVPNVTLIYLSIDGFTYATERMSGRESVGLLNAIVDAFDAAGENAGVERVKTMGEHYVAACGLSVPRLDHAERAVAFVNAVALEVKRLGAEFECQLGLRASLASGTVHAGLVGNQRFVYDVWGRPLNLVRRLVHETARDEVRITAETYQDLTPDNGFTERPALYSSTEGQVACYGREIQLTSTAVPMARDKASAVPPTVARTRTDV